MSDQRTSGEQCRKGAPPKIRYGCFGLLFAMLPLAANAGIRWLCWFDGGDAIHCFLDPLALSGDGTAIADVEKARLAAELPPNMPGLAREIRLNPERFAQVGVVVPMFAPPESLVRVHELAQAVMCGSRIACSAVMTPTPLNIDLLRLLEDDPALD